MKVINRYKSWKRNKKILREKPEAWLFQTQNFGYIQIPKVATRSIQECLAQFYVEQNELIQPKEWDKEKIKDIEKLTASHMTQKKLQDVAEQCFIFAFVRDPYERLYSAYKNKVLQPASGNGKNIFSNHGVTLGMSLGDFVDIVCEIPDEKIDRHLKSQSWFLTYEERVIPNYIGRLECFEEDWSILSKKFNLPVPEHRNKAISGEIASTKFSSLMKEQIWRRYERDFVLFAYNK